MPPLRSKIPAPHPSTACSSALNSFNARWFAIVISAWLLLTMSACSPSRAEPKRLFQHVMHDFKQRIGAWESTRKKVNLPQLKTQKVRLRYKNTAGKWLPLHYNIYFKRNEIIYEFAAAMGPLTGQTIHFQRRAQGKHIYWRCNAGNLAMQSRIAACQSDGLGLRL